MDVLLQAVLIGIGATLAMDIWAFIQKHFFGIPSLDYRFVGRWLGHVVKGKLTHNTVIQSKEIKGEIISGWIAHYAIGIIFSIIFIYFAGLDWLKTPSLLPALCMGVFTVVAPFFIMQPCFGFGFAASKLQQPNLARIRSLIAHATYGIGLYMSALFLEYFWLFS